LRHLPRYVTGDAAGERAVADGVKLPDGEELLGVYDNPEGPAVYVTNRSVRWMGEHAVEYSRITESNVPGDKTEANRLVVTLTDGTSETVPVAGGEGRLRDVWEFKRYMDRVVEDTRSA
jgi:hypothetical protein